MFKLVFLGIWVIAVTAAAAFGAAVFRSNVGEKEAAQMADPGVEELKTEMTSVPMIRGGQIIGYVIIQLSFAADRQALADFKLEPTPYLVDAAFRVIFASTEVDFRRLRGSDLNRLTESIAAEANARIGGALVRQVLIQQLNFVRKEDIRTNWIGVGNTEQ